MDVVAAKISEQAKPLFLFFIFLWFLGARGGNKRISQINFMISIDSWVPKPLQIKSYG